MTTTRISLPAPADYIAHVLLGAARGSNGPVEVWASRDGAELVAETVKVEPPRSEAPDDHCVCGHVRSQHIYWEGACRPGWFCRCAMFVEVEQAPAPSAAGTGKDEAPVPATIADAAPLASAAGAGPSTPSPAPAPVAPHPAGPSEPGASSAAPAQASTASEAADAEAGAGESAAEPATAAAPEPEPAAGSEATCRRCSNPIIGRRADAAYCSERCKNAASAGRSMRTRVIVPCAGCGNDMPRPSGRGPKAGYRCDTCKAAPPAPVVPAREKPEKPVVLPVPDAEPEQQRPAAGNPIAVERKQHECEHCGARFADKKALGLHRAAIHPIRAMKPRHEPLGEAVHIVVPHTSSRSA